MDAKTFLANFGHMVNAPEGIAKIRGLILSLATRGSLVSQSLDRTAFDLLAKVEGEKRTLVAARALRRPKSHAEVAKRDEPHQLPASWAWVRFGRIAQHNAGKTLDSKRNTGSSRCYITTSNLYWGRFDLSNIKEMLIRDDELDRYSIQKNDLLICEGGEAGRAAVWENDDSKICFQNHIHRARFYADINPFYVYRILEKMSLTGEIDTYRKGVGISNMSGKALASIPIPLPPVEEQTRIVAKVEELMTLCDQLEAQQQARRQLQRSLRRASLNALANADNPRDLQISWHRLATHFGQLFSTPEDITSLKEVILDLAANGLLLPHEERSKNLASELIEHIARVRRLWQASAIGQELKEANSMLLKLKKQHANLPESPLPENWCWATLLQVSQAVVDCHNKTAPYVSNGIHLVRTSDVRDGRMDLRNTKKISEETYAYWARRMLPKAGDIFFTREAPMGEAALVPENQKICLGQRVMLVRLFSEYFSNRYLLYAIRSPSFQRRMKQSSIGMGVKHLRVGDVEDLSIPVPPKDEQDKIVARIDDLFAICDKLQVHLADERRTAANLSNAAVSALTGINAEQKEESPMRIPQTQLSAPLRLGQTPKPKDTAPLASILLHTDGELDANDLFQRFGGEIDAFYAQLKTEVTHGWIVEPAPATVREIERTPVTETMEG